MLFAISVVDSTVRCVALRQLYSDLLSTYLFNVRVSPYYAIYRFENGLQSSDLLDKIDPLIRSFSGFAFTLLGLPSH